MGKEDKILEMDTNLGKAGIDPESLKNALERAEANMQRMAKARRRRFTSGGPNSDSCAQQTSS